MSSTKDLTATQIYIRLLGYVKSYWWLFLLSFIGYGMYSLTQAAWAEVIGYMVENIENPDAQNYIILPAAILGIFFVRGVGSFMGQYSTMIVARTLVHKLRVQVFDKILYLPSHYFTENSTGHILSRVTFNVEQVTGAATDALKIFLREGTTVIALLGYMFYLSWQLTLIFLSVSPIIALVVGYASKRFRTLSKRIQSSMGDITHSASESIQGYQVVRVFGGEQYESKRFRDASAYNRRQSLKLALTQSLNTPIVQFIVSIAISLLVFMALHPSFLENITSELFIKFIVATGLVAKPIRMLTNVNSKIQKAIAAAYELFAVLDREIEKNSGTKTLGRAKGAIEFNQVDFEYESGKRILSDVSLSIEPGQTVALVGRSGSGKTTLANLLPRFYDAQSGRVTLDETPLDDYDLQNLRSQIALVNQNVFLFKGSLKDNIAYGDMANASDDEVLAAAKAAHVIEFADKLSHGLDTEIGEKGLMLSGGQRQRIAIARAILKDAPVLVLDEATSALDNESERHIQQALEKVMENRTTIVIAHRLSTIESADKIVVLDQGQIKEVGSHSELLSQEGLYSQLYQSQFKD